MTEQAPDKRKAKLFSFKYFSVDFIRVTAVFPSIIWYRPRVLFENEKAKKKIKGPALLISNHTGFLDPAYLQLCVWYRRHRFICNQNFYNSRMKFFFKMARCIPIDIDNFNLGSLKEITETLNKGEIVTMFPEGHINDGSGEMRTFKGGMVLMAMRARVPIVPIYVKAHKPVYTRLTMMVGEPIDIFERFGPRPTLSQIEELTTELFNKENEFKKRLENL